MDKNDLVLQKHVNGKKFKRMAIEKKQKDEENAKKQQELKEKKEERKRLWLSKKSAVSPFNNLKIRIANQIIIQELEAEQMDEDEQDDDNENGFPIDEDIQLRDNEDDEEDEEIKPKKSTQKKGKSAAPVKNGKEQPKKKEQSTNGVQKKRKQEETAPIEEEEVEIADLPLQQPEKKAKSKPAFKKFAVNKKPVAKKSIKKP